MSVTQTALLTIGEVADELRVQSWQIRRLFQRKLLPEPAKLGKTRVFTGDDIPAIRDAMIASGYMKP